MTLWAYVEAHPVWTFVYLVTICGAACIMADSLSSWWTRRGGR